MIDLAAVASLIIRCRLLVGHCQKTILAACLRAVVMTGEFGGHLLDPGGGFAFGDAAVSVASAGVGAADDVNVTFEGHFGGATYAGGSGNYAPIGQGMNS